jgi:sugar phosphate isomerase/epimerase
VVDRVRGPILGTTLFSLTPLWRSGADPAEVLECLAVAGCGPAIEVIGHQTWRGFPALSAADERVFRSTLDRTGLIPVALGVYTDLYRRAGRTMTIDEAFDDIRPQLEAAARLGFGAVRATLGMEPALMRRVLAEAERLNVVLTFELQGMTAPDTPTVVDVLTLHAETGSPYLGFTVDFSLSTADLPASFDAALRRFGLSSDRIGVIHEAWRSRRMGAALAALAGHRDQAVLVNLVAGVVGRCGHSQPADWAEVLPLARHAHAKFWDPDVESVRAPHGAWLTALIDAGYTGAVVSEWGGHELLDSADADPLTVTRTHVELLSELAGRPAVTA